MVASNFYCASKWLAWARTAGLTASHEAISRCPKPEESKEAGEQTSVCEQGLRSHSAPSKGKLQGQYLGWARIVNGLDAREIVAAIVEAQLHVLVRSRDRSLDVNEWQDRYRLDHYTDPSQTQLDASSSGLTYMLTVSFGTKSATGG